MTEKKDTRASLKINADLHRQLRVAVAEANERMEVFVERALRAELRNHKMRQEAEKLAETVQAGAEIALKGHRKVVKNG